MPKVTFDYKNILPKIAGQNILTLCSNCIAYESASYDQGNVYVRDIASPVPTKSFLGCEQFIKRPYPQDTRMGVIIVFPIHRTRKP